MNDFSVFENLEQIDGSFELFEKILALAIQDVKNRAISRMSHVRIHACVGLIVNLDVS